MEHIPEILRLFIEAIGLCITTAVVTIRSARKDRREYHAKMEAVFNELLDITTEYQSKLLECKADLLAKMAELLDLEKSILNKKQ